VKELIDTLFNSGITLKDIEKIDLNSELNSKKKIDIYLGKNLQNSYVVVLDITKKSRILQKEAKEIMDLVSKLEFLREIRAKKRYIYLKAPICSKAKRLFENQKYKFLNL